MPVIACIVQTETQLYNGMKMNDDEHQTNDKRDNRQNPPSHAPASDGPISLGSHRDQRGFKNENYAKVL